MKSTIGGAWVAWFSAVAAALLFLFFCVPGEKSRSGKHVTVGPHGNAVVASPGETDGPDANGTGDASGAPSPLFDELASDRLADEDFRAYRELVHDFETDGALAQVSLTVLDEDGRPVPSANVTMSFTSPGGDGEYMAKAGTTDESGLFVSRGMSCWDVVWRVEKPGFHGCRGNLPLRPYISLQGKEEGRWFRAPFPVTAILRKKESPHEMRVYDATVSLPLSGDSMGFDLLDGKPMPPYGDGRHCDVRFSAFHDSDEWKRGNDADRASTVRIEFPGGGDGGTVVAKDEFCDLDTPRHAPEAGYSPVLESTIRVVSGKYLEYERIKTDQYILFKVRGECDGDGNGFYGKIKGDWRVNGPKRKLWFRVWINTERGNRNLEDTSGW